ncbi:hypothetical protein [Veronia pacifica]|uniref:Uncharacterized protein n=1 Tax=Veronia pacifica TaxID=1080227 RepID=A0A1C3ED27_9GAMM|nr:hypothetical protein [Veronia pacifica]ODA31143.1 hypothetical protein A8L45_17980 [Veronia pacifica]
MIKSIDRATTKSAYKSKSFKKTDNSATNSDAKIKTKKRPKRHNVNSEALATKVKQNEKTFRSKIPKDIESNQVLLKTLQEKPFTKSEEGKAPGTGDDTRIQLYSTEASTNGRERGLFSRFLGKIDGFLGFDKSPERRARKVVPQGWTRRLSGAVQIKGDPNVKNQKHYEVDGVKGEITHKSPREGAGRTTYHKDDVYDALMFSHIAYEDNVTKATKKHLGDRNLDLVEFDGLPSTYSYKNGVYTLDSKSKHGTLDGQASVWHDKDTGKLHVSFRGTEGNKFAKDPLALLKDIKTDANMLFSLSGIPTDDFLPLMDEVNKYAKEQNLDVVVSGHSLGGWYVNNIAELADERYKGGPLDDATYVGFSSPYFARNANVLNVGLDDDPIYGAASPSSYHTFGEPKAHREGPHVGRFFFGDYTPAAHLKLWPSHERGVIREVVDQLFR